MKRFLRLILGSAVILCCSGCGRRQETDIIPRQSVDTAMGTVIQQTVYCTEEKTSESFFADAMELLDNLEKELLSWRLDTSEIYRANASGGKEEGVLLSEELADILKQCMELYEKSEGAFDIAIGPTARLWNIDQWAAGLQEGEYRLPDPEELKAALELCGGDKIRLEEGEQPRLFMPDGMQLDLGAVGKGLALAELGRLLEEQPEITGAVISLGGSVLTYGSKPDGSSWKVGIVNPADTSSHIGILSLEGQWCVSTSGDYERYVEVDGVRYHHILDPGTGYPAQSGVRGVTVLSKNGLLSDGLSTACFILGVEKGMALAKEYGAEALFVLENGEIRMTEGMKAFFS